jgi:NADPH:quinone reductase-like Zn-dependent oxidoreductase
MRAVVQDRYGPPEVLSIVDMETPVPTDTEVLVRIHAASVNARDWHIMRGDPYIARLMSRALFGRSGPRHSIRGGDIAGRVEAIGARVTRFKPGDEVYGDLGPGDGGFAEFVAVAADQLGPKPSNLTFQEAAAVPMAGATALVALREVTAGQRVLINGASGGVGTFAVQLARAVGAEVTAVCSARNAELVRSLGADHVVDYARTDFTRPDAPYDIILDLVGNRSLADLRRALTPTGTLLLSGGGSSTGVTLFGPMGIMLRAKAAAPFIRPRVVVHDVGDVSTSLPELTTRIEAGALRPIVDRTFTLDETPAAIRYVEVEHARAKVVIQVV